MLPRSELHNYKLQVELLQEKLQRSEEKRNHLENKMKDLMAKRSEYDEIERTTYRFNYGKFLEEKRQRGERNRKLLEMMDRIDQQAANLAAKSEMFKKVKDEYEYYYSKILDSPYTTRTAKYKIPFLPLANEPYSCFHTTTMTPTYPALLSSTPTPIETPRSATYPTSYRQIYPAPIALPQQACPYQHFHPCHGGYLCESIYPATSTAAVKSPMESINRYDTPRKTEEPQTTKANIIDRDLDQKIKSVLEREIEIIEKPKDIDENIYSRKSNWMAPEKLPAIHKLNFQDVDNDADRSSVSITNTTDSIDKDNLNLKKYESTLGSLFNGEIKTAIDRQETPARYLYEDVGEVDDKEEIVPPYLSRNYYDESLGIGTKEYGENSLSSVQKENDDGEDVDSLKFQKKEKIDIENIETAIYGERLNPDDVNDTTTSIGKDILLKEDDKYLGIQSAIGDFTDKDKPFEVEESILSAPSLVNNSLGDVQIGESVVEETVEPIAEPQATEEYNYENYEQTEGGEYDYSNYDPSQYPTDYDPSAYGYTYDEQTGQYLDENQQPYDPNAAQEPYDPNALQQPYDTGAEGNVDYSNYEGYDQQYAEQPATEEVPVEPEPESSSPKSILSPEKIGDTNSLKKKKKVNFLENETDESSSTAKPEQPVSNESDFDFSAN
ncbi:hypothetical protein ACFFRR_005992 [Megaselia abdita]